MQEFIQNLPLPFFHSWGYIFLLAVTILEAMPFGFLIPGHAVIIFYGFLAKLKLLDMFDVIWIASLGAMTGDFINYYIGKKYGLKFIIRYGKYFFFKKEFFDKTKELMNRHTGKTLIIGRFNSITRAFAPFIAGSSDVPIKKFIFYNIIGGISWAASGVFLGNIFGHGYQIAARYVGTVALAAIILGIIMVYLFKFINEQKRVFVKYDLAMLLFNIFSLYIFFKIAEDVSTGEIAAKYDVVLSRIIPLYWTPLLNKAMAIITSLGNIENVIFISFLLFVILLIRKKWTEIIVLFSSLGGGLLIAFSAKLIFHRARPVYSLVSAETFSFPSTHAAAAMIFAVLLVHFFKNDIGNRLLKIAFILLSFFLALLVAFSRLYLNIHWLSDVIAGLALGIFWTTLIILIFKYTSSVVEKLNIKSKKEYDNF